MTAGDEISLGSLRRGYRAVVIGASGGIGAALCATLEADPLVGDVIGISRKLSGLDFSDEKTIEAQAALIAQPIDLLICATGALTIEGIPPEKSLKQINPENMAAQFLANAIGPALIAKHLLPLMSRQDRCIAAFLSARVGSIADNRLGGWISYRASKAALNQVVRTASIEFARTHPKAVVLAVHPGTVATQLSEPYSRGHKSVPPDVAARNILGTIDNISGDRSGSFVAYDGSAIPW